jgi:hypothetical protein
LTSHSFAVASKGRSSLQLALIHPNAAIARARNAARGVTRGRFWSCRPRLQPFPLNSEIVAKTTTLFLRKNREIF